MTRFSASRTLERAVPAVLAVLLLGAGHLEAFQLRRAQKASLNVVAEKTAYLPGEAAHVAAVMTIDRGWHTNSHQPTFDYLIATEATFTAPEGWPRVEVSYPPGEMKSFGFADQPLSVYEGEVAIVGSFEVPDDALEGEWPIEVGLTFQACDDRSCLPPLTTTQTLMLTVGPGGEATGSGLFEVPPAAAVEARHGPDGSGREPAGFALMLFLAVMGGLILNAMPCVLPVLSLKVFGLVKSASQGRSHVVVGSLATAAGILVSFWALALAAIVARSLGATIGWGVQFQEPTFVAFLAVVVVLFCLNLWGLFEITLPMGLAQFADSGPKEGIPGHLVSGLFATLMATPCSAPFLGTAVGFGLSQSSGTIFAVFTAIAIGMALPYLILAAAPGAARFLPKPGAWMVTLKGFMGFLLAAAVVWLFYVLASQMSSVRLAFLELALLGLALFVWLRHAASTRWVRIVAVLGALACTATTIGLAAGSHGYASTRVSESSEGLIDWVTFDQIEAERLVSEESRLVFVDVTADWCFTCKVNERLVLETREIADAFDRHGVIPMKADWTNRNDTIAGYLAEHGRYGVPFYLLYRPGDEPYLFSELLTKEAVIEALDSAGG